MNILAFVGDKINEYINNIILYIDEIEYEMFSYSVYATLSILLA